MAPRFTPLSERDVAVVSDVYRLRYASTSQVLRLRFRDVSSKTPAYRSLSRLEGLGLVRAFTVPNVPERIFRLTDRGAAFLADHRGVTLDELPLHTRGRTSPRFYHFMQHFLGVGDVRIAIEQDIQARTDVALPVWIPEYASRVNRRGRPVSLLRAVVPASRGKLGHTPDAAFVVETTRAAGLFFLEYDRGTESLTNPEKGVLRFVRFYQAALQVDPYAPLRRHAANIRPGFRVLIVCESQGRLDSMRQRLSKALAEPERGVLRFFWGAVAPVDDPLSVPWHSLLDGDGRPYYLVSPV